MHRWIIALALVCALFYLAPFYWDCRLHDDGRIDEFSPVPGISSLGVGFMFILTLLLIFFSLNPYKRFNEISYKRLAWFCGSILAILHIIQPFVYLQIQSLNKSLAEHAFNPSNGYQAQAESVPYIVVNWEVLIPLSILGFILLVAIFIANTPEFKLGASIAKKRKKGIVIEGEKDPWKIIYLETISLYPEFASRMHLSASPSEDKHEIPGITENIDEEAICPYCSYEFTARYQGEPGDAVEITCPRCNRSYGAIILTNLSLGPGLSQ